MMVTYFWSFRMLFGPLKLKMISNCADGCVGTCMYEPLLHASAHPTCRRPFTLAQRCTQKLNVVCCSRFLPQPPTPPLFTLANHTLSHTIVLTPPANQVNSDRHGLSLSARFVFFCISVSFYLVFKLKLR